MSEAHKELENDWKGNFNLMPFDAKLHYRQEMRGCIKKKEELNASLRNLCKLDLYFLSHSFLGFTDTTPSVHRPFCDHIESHPKASINMMPRGYFKSSVGTIGRSIQLALNDPLERILIANATATLAEKFVRRIGMTFKTNRYIQELFPELIPTNYKRVKWSDSAVELNRPVPFPEATFEAIGVEGTVVGRHYTTIFFDDLVNEDHIASISQMDKVIDWYKLLYGSLGVKGGFNCIHNATRWSYYDVISWVMDNQQFPSFSLSCYNGDRTESTFPEIYSMEKLEELKTVKGLHTFSAQFENDPLPSGVSVFQKDWMQFKDPPEGAALRKFLLVDPAISEGNLACQRVVMVVGVDEDFNWYVLDYSFGFYPLIHPEKQSLVGTIFSMHMAHSPTFTGVEEIGFQKALSYLVYKEMDERKHWFFITPMRPEGKETKSMRIESLAAPFGSKKVFLRPDMENEELHKQLIGYPAYRYKDMVDALSYLMKYAWPTSQSVVKGTYVKENTLKDIQNRIMQSKEGQKTRPFKLIAGGGY